MTKKWISIEDNELDFSSTKDDMFLIYPSPFDVPKALRSEFDKKSLEIYFKYIGDDERVTTEQHDGVVIYLGRYSGRIYKIKINDVDKKNNGNVTLLASIKKAIGKVSERESGRAAAKWNYRSAKKILDNHSGELLKFA